MLLIEALLDGFLACHQFTLEFRQNGVTYLTLSGQCLKHLIELLSFSGQLIAKSGQSVNFIDIDAFGSEQSLVCIDAIDQHGTLLDLIGKNLVHFDG